MTTWEHYLESRRTEALEQFLNFLRIPSISALPEHAGDVQRAAQWVADRMAMAGLEGVQVMPTAGHPVVYGAWLHAPGRPTVLVYGHFDVQPVDPLDLWSSPPFAPALRDERIYARGASDMKGNLLMTILAIEALLQADGRLPLNLKCLFEGEEEIGSPSIAAFLADNRDLLACDLVLNADAGQWSEDQPALWIGFKGLTGAQIDVRGARTDLHSGLYGGAVANPIHALAQLLASMRGTDGAILVEGFYDQALPLSDDDRAQLAAIPFDEVAYMRQIGVKALVGEPGYTPQEQLWARPTLEVNGIWGGFQGEGIKTVLPNAAHAKITCRLVPDQDPAAIQDALAAHVARHTPRGVEATLNRLPGSARSYLVPKDHWGNQAAATVLAELYGRQPYYGRVGGSIPVLNLFLETLGAYAANVGFTLDDEQFHAPDEFFRLSSFARGPIVYGRLFHRLAQGDGA